MAGEAPSAVEAPTAGAAATAGAVVGRVAGEAPSVGAVAGRVAGAVASDLGADARIIENSSSSEILLMLPVASILPPRACVCESVCVCV